MLTLFHAPRSRSSRILFLMEELGEPYELVRVDIRRADGSGTADARDPHPDKKVPALIHDGLLVTESAAICLYLTDAFPGAELGPQVGDPLRGAYLTWLSYFPGVIEPLFTAKATGWTTYNPRQAAWGEFDAMIARILDGIKTPGGYVLGEHFSTIDAMMLSALMFAEKLLPADPAIDAYRARIMARPAFQRAMAKDDSASGMQAPA